MNERPDSAVLELATARGVDAVLAGALVDGAPEPWWTSAEPSLLAADIALLAPLLGVDEARVRIGTPEVADGPWDLSIVVYDRPGLLATTARVLADQGLTIVSARIASWSSHGLALQRIGVVPVELPLSGEPDWPFIGQKLRTALTGPVDAPVESAMLPDGCAVRAVRPGRALSQWFIDIEANDEIGLLARIAGTLQALGADVIAADIRSHEGRAVDTFLVHLEDPSGLRTVQALAAQSQLADHVRRMTMAS